MMIKMWRKKMVMGDAYITTWNRAFYQWSPRSKRWYRMISQASGWQSMKDAEANGFIQWVKLTNKIGIFGLE